MNSLTDLKMAAFVALQEKEAAQREQARRDEEARQVKRQQEQAHLRLALLEALGGGHWVNELQWGDGAYTSAMLALGVWAGMNGPNVRLWHECPACGKSLLKEQAVLHVSDQRANLVRLAEFLRDHANRTCGCTEDEE